MNINTFDVERLHFLITEYIRLSDLMEKVLLELKESLLLFNTKRLNKVLDEKMVLSEEVVRINNEMSQLIQLKYGEFSSNTALLLISDYPFLKSSWETLTALMSRIKGLLKDIKRILSMIEKYNKDLFAKINRSRPSKFVYGPKYLKKNKV